MKIVVIGMGYVGISTSVCFAEKGYEVICIDIDKEKIDMLNKNKCPIFEKNLENLIEKNHNSNKIKFTTDYKAEYRNAKIIFICTQTPPNKNGSVNLKCISRVIEQIAEVLENDCLIVIKSTVPVGTCKRIENRINKIKKNKVNIEVASNPEFLSQGNAINDILNAKRIVIGTNSIKAEKILKKIYRPFNIPIVSVNRESSEMTKYACNNFLALKISYINEIANLCEITGADIQEVTIGMGYDDRIGNKFLNAGIGYGGSCFFKDEKALLNIAKKNKLKLRTVKASIEANNEQNIRLYEIAKKNEQKFKNKKIAVLGLAFKSNTDDVRETPALKNIKLLLNDEANIFAFDPKAIDNFKNLLNSEKYNGQIRYVKSIKESLKNADMCFIFTEWDEIKNINIKDFTDLMKTPIIYDGRNIFDKNKMKSLGIKYYTIGRK